MQNVFEILPSLNRGDMSLDCQLCQSSANEEEKLYIIFYVIVINEIWMRNSDRITIRYEVLRGKWLLFRNINPTKRGERVGSE